MTKKKRSVWLYQKHGRKFPQTRKELSEMEQFLWERNYRGKR